MLVEFKNPAVAVIVVNDEILRKNMTHHNMVPNHLKLSQKVTAHFNITKLNICSKDTDVLTFTPLSQNIITLSLRYESTNKAPLYFCSHCRCNVLLIEGIRVILSFNDVYLIPLPVFKLFAENR